MTTELQATPNNYNLSRFQDKFPILFQAAWRSGVATVSVISTPNPGRSVTSPVSVPSSPAPRPRRISRLRPPRASGWPPFSPRPALSAVSLPLPTSSPLLPRCPVEGSRPTLHQTVGAELEKDMLTQEGGSEAVRETPRGSLNETACIELRGARSCLGGGHVGEFAECWVLVGMGSEYGPPGVFGASGNEVVSTYCALGPRGCGTGQHPLCAWHCAGRFGGADV